MKHEHSILLVEDNADDEELTRLAFEQSGIACSLEIVRDGAEAIDYLLAGRADVEPCLVLLDLKLPKIGGLEVLRRLREDQRTRLLPVVILTSSVEEQDVIRAYDLGCNSYIRKPVDFIRFTEVVRNLGRYWLDINEPPFSVREEE